MTTESAYDLAFIVTTAPNAGYLGQEIFDLVVAAGVFDQRILVAFANDGLLHLTENSAEAERKSLSKLWQSAHLFGVERFIAVTDTLNVWPQPNWTPSSLLTQVEPRSADELAAILKPIPRVTLL